MPQALARSTRALASEIGRPPGSRLGRQPASTAPRSPARRGIQAIRAPVDRLSASTAVSVPDDRAARSPTKITESASNCTPAGNWFSVAASAPGTVLIKVAPCLRAPLLRYGARVQDFRPVFRLALRSRRKIVPASSSASNETSSTPDAVSRSAKVTGAAPGRAAEPAIAWARNSASSAVCGRERKSMLLVPSTARANLE